MVGNVRPAPPPQQPPHIVRHVKHAVRRGLAQGPYVCRGMQLPLDALQLCLDRGTAFLQHAPRE